MLGYIFMQRPGRNAPDGIIVGGNDAKAELKCCKCTEGTVIAVTTDDCMKRCRRTG